MQCLRVMATGKASSSRLNSSLDVSSTQKAPTLAFFPHQGTLPLPCALYSMDVTYTASAPVPSQQPVGFHTVSVLCSGVHVTSFDGSRSPANAHGRQKAFVRRGRLELTLFCSELHGMHIQEICHLTAWPNAQHIPSLTCCFIHR